MFHFRLPASGWAFFQVVYGGESFAALSTGLQNAFHAAGGVPYKVRTDSLSAAYKNNSTQEAFTERYAQLAQHYHFQATRNNQGIAHENGAIESAHRHVKKHLEQALILRGSSDFETRQDYEAFIAHLMQQRNRRKQERFLLEQRQLQTLPLHPSVNYDELYVTVKRTSTIDVKRVTYTVPSRLVGSKLLVRVYDSHLALYSGANHIVDLERRFGQQYRRAHNIDYRHIIDALAKKPRAFRQTIWRDELLPSNDYRAIWAYADKHLMADDACYYIVGLLHLAYKADCEKVLADFILQGIKQEQLPTLRECESRFLVPSSWVPEIAVQQHPLHSYQALLGGQHG